MNEDYRGYLIRETLDAGYRSEYWRGRRDQADEDLQRFNNWMRQDNPDADGFAPATPNPDPNPVTPDFAAEARAKEREVLDRQAEIDAAKVQAKWDADRQAVGAMLNG